MSTTPLPTGPKPLYGAASEGVNETMRFSRFGRPPQEGEQLCKHISLAFYEIQLRLGLFTKAE